MPGERAIDDTRPEPFRWWFLPSWMGLDAPCVVTTWTWATSRASGTALPVRPAVAMFLVVWAIYLTDRLIDVARCRDWTKATGRLRFGRNYRPVFLVCLGCCAAGLLGLLGAGLPVDVIERAAVVACGVGLHCLAFVTPVFLRSKLPGKEFGVGLFFALGAYACLGSARHTLPFLVSIAGVVAFNCLVIAARDADSDRANDPGGASRWWRTMNRDLSRLGVAFTLAAVLSSVLVGETAFFLSLAASFASLTALHRAAHRFSGDAVRALADFVLFTPIPIMGLLNGDHGKGLGLGSPPAFAIPMRKIDERPDPTVVFGFNWDGRSVTLVGSDHRSCHDDTSRDRTARRCRGARVRLAVAGAAREGRRVCR